MAGLGSTVKNMANALTGNSSQGVNPADLLQQLQQNQDIQATVGQYMPQHLRQNLFLPEAGTSGFFGQHPRLATGLEDILLGQASMDQIPQTTGQGISMVAKSLMAGPMAHRQWQMQQVMMPFQIAQQMGEISKTQGEAAMNRAKAQFFGAHAGYYDRGEGAGISTQDRTYTNMSPQLASDGKMYGPDEPMPEGVKFVPKAAAKPPYGSGRLATFMAGMDGKLPEQTMSDLSPEELNISKSHFADLYHMALREPAQAAGARNYAPGAVSPEDEWLGRTVTTVSNERVSAMNKQIEDLRSDKIYTMAPPGTPDKKAWAQQQIGQISQAIQAEQFNRIQAVHKHDFTAYMPEVESGVRTGKYSLPEMGSGSNLSPGAQQYMSNWNK